MIVSESTLLSTFKPTLSNGQPAKSIDPVALSLLNARRPNGQFLIPTPGANGRYSGSEISPFREDQFNTNFDYHVNQNLLCWIIHACMSLSSQTLGEQYGSDFRLSEWLK